MARALFEDTDELALSRTGVGVGLAGSADALAQVRDLAWPGTGEVVLDPNRPVSGLSSLPGAVATVLLPPDVTDLPGLLAGWDATRALVSATPRT